MPKQQPRPYPFRGGYEHRGGLGLDPAYAELRSQGCPAAAATPTGEHIILVTGYDQARTVLARPDTFSRAASNYSDDLRDQHEAFITDIEGPRHKAQRDLVNRTFAKDRVEALRPRTQQVADELLNDMRHQAQPADLIARFAVPLTVAVISEILGIPQPDQQQFGAWARAFLTHGPDATDEQKHSAGAAYEHLYTYMRRQLDNRASSPGDDLLSVLAASPTPPQAVEITAHERILLAIAALVAGFETSASMIGNMAYWLLYRHPDWWTRLHHHPDQVDRAVEEMLRLIPVDARDGMARGTTRDVEIAGTPVPAGVNVLIAKAAANRDPHAFTAPDSFDPDRYAPDRPAPKPHLAFGHGPHVCPGAHLARMELQVALRQLLTHFPRLRGAVPEKDLRWKSTTMRGLAHFPVTWD